MTLGGAPDARDTATPGGLIRHRPAVDGLRGIAVLLVLLCHTWVPFVHQAGSVGVTLFFVLSGFLITRLLMAERARTGRVSYRTFYARRARRLLPALGLLLAAVSAYLLASHQSLMPVLLTVAYSANLANQTGHSLGNLDHMWSLCLEEQFYLVWPIVLPFVARHRRPLVLLALAVAAVIALRGGLWLTGVPMTRIYYGADTRVDAILVGCGLALIGPKVVGQSWVKPAGQWGAVTLAAAFVMPDSSLVWILTPLPFACAAVILWAEQQPARVLTCRPLVFTGQDQLRAVSVEPAGGPQPAVVGPGPVGQVPGAGRGQLHAGGAVMVRGRASVHATSGRGVRRDRASGWSGSADQSVRSTADGARRPGCPSARWRAAG